MKELFDAVLFASISGGIMIVLILILRLSLKAAPKRYVCLLWLLAAVRLLVPLNIESSLSLQPKVEQVTIQREDPSANTVMEVSGIEVDFGVSAVVVPSGSVQIPAEQIDHWLTESGGHIAQRQPTDVMPTVWLSVTCGFLAYTAISYAVLKYRVRDAVAVDGNVYECAAISAPFLLGYFRPRIYLPVGLPAGDLEHILAHERAHIRWLDNWTKLFGFLCVAVHWFNPLVWVAYILLCRDMEMACDEVVVRDMTLEDRKSYSKALVNCAANMRMVSACPVAFGEGSVKQRILKVLNYRRSVFWISVLSVIALVFVAVCFLTNPAEPEPLYGMDWLRSLDAKDVKTIRFSVAANPLSYTDYTPEEVPEILEFLQSCDGTLIEDNRYPPAAEGEQKHFFVTMNDGTVYTLTSWGTYVLIEGRAYKDCLDWLHRWPETGRIHVSAVERMLNALEQARTRKDFYLNVGGEGKPNQTWMRYDENWFQFTDDNGACQETLFYDGQYYRNAYRYIGRDYVTEGGEWKAESMSETFDLPWPMNCRQDPADYEHVETIYNEYGVPTVTLRYLPDGTLLRLLVQEEGGWISRYDVESSDGAVVHHNLWSPNSSGTGIVLYGHYLEATGQLRDLFDNTQMYTREELDAQEERCRVALAAFQAADSYSLVQKDLGYDPNAEETMLLIWDDGDNWLRQYQVEVRTYSYLQYEGRQYQKYTSTTMTKPWSEAELSAEVDCRDSWLREYQWDPKTTYCELYSGDPEHEGYTRINLLVLDEAVENGCYYMQFTLDDQGKIRNVSKNWTVGNGNPGRSSYIQVYYSDGNAVADYIAEAYREAAGE